MATIKEGINGGFSGKAGTVVGYYRMGKWIIRALPKKSRKNKRGSVQQNTCRAKFTAMQLFLKPLLPFVRTGFNMEGRVRQMTAHNAAKSHNMHAFTEDDRIDYRKVLISYGKLPGADSVAVESCDAGLQVSWDPKLTVAPGDVQSNSFDQVILLAYYLVADKDDKGIRVFGRPTGARRKTGTDVIEIPPFRKGKSFHVWMAFVSDNREWVSTSQYLGEYIF